MVMMVPAGQGACSEGAAAAAMSPAGAAGAGAGAAADVFLLTKTSSMSLGINSTASTVPNSESSNAAMMATMSHWVSDAGVPPGCRVSAFASNASSAGLSTGEQQHSLRGCVLAAVAAAAAPHAPGDGAAATAAAACSREPSTCEISVRGIIASAAMAAVAPVSAATDGNMHGGRASAASRGSGGGVGGAGRVFAAGASPISMYSESQYMGHADVMDILPPVDVEGSEREGGELGGCSSTEITAAITASAVAAAACCGSGGSRTFVASDAYERYDAQPPAPLSQQGRAQVQQQQAMMKVFIDNTCAAVPQGYGRRLAASSSDDGGTVNETTNNANYSAYSVTSGNESSARSALAEGAARQRAAVHSSSMHQDAPVGHHHHQPLHVHHHHQKHGHAQQHYHGASTLLMAMMMPSVVGGGGGGIASSLGCDAEPMMLPGSTRTTGTGHSPPVFAGLMATPSTGSSTATLQHTGQVQVQGQLRASSSATTGYCSERSFAAWAGCGSGGCTLNGTGTGTGTGTAGSSSTTTATATGGANTATPSSSSDASEAATRALSAAAGRRR